jgi:2-dehydropantoate 2-reductase
MKILVIGVGGIGGFIGSYLVNNNYDVTFVARKKRLSYLKSNGLKLDSELGKIYCPRIKVTEEIPEKESFDIIINTVKLYDFDSVLDEIKNKIKNKPLILPFQNGIYAEEKLKKKFPGVDTIGAVAQISVFVDENQTIKHVGKLATFFVGGYDVEENKLLEDFCDSVQKIGLKIIFKINIKEKIWQKFIFLSAYSGMTTFFLKSIGQIFEDKVLKKKFTDAMLETYNLSKKFGVSFKNDPVKFWLEKIKSMPFNMTSSMHVDFNNNKKLELDWLSGSIEVLSKNYNMKCPIHSEIVEGIKKAK